MMETASQGDGMANSDWSRQRELFEKVCDLPQAQWRSRLEALTEDRAVIDEVMALLQAQTISFNRALGPLGQLMATLPEAELQVGDRLGQWQLVERLASGGMGTVFVAERADHLFRQRVAIKLLRGLADAGVANRLAEERRILAELEHPGIARLFDGGTTPGGHPYLVMEYVPGAPLDVQCECERLDLHARVHHCLRVCQAVQAAHQRLVIHCDIKPSNILMRDADSPVLLDFGIAQVLGQGSSDPLAFCTPAYASPEQLTGASLGVTSDVFSLGILLTELLACEKAGRTVADRDIPVSLPSELAGDDCRWRNKLHGDLDAIAAKACALSPQARYASVQELMSDLTAWLDCRPVAAVNGGWPYRARRFLRRHAVASSIAAFGLVALVAGLGVALWQGQQARLQRDHALAESAKSRAVLEFMGGLFELADPQAARGRDVTAGELLERGVQDMRGRFAKQPEVRAELLGAMANARRGLGLYDEALPLAEEAVALADRVGDPALRRNQALQRMRILHHLGRYKDALAALDALAPTLAGDGREAQLARATADYQRALALQADNQREAARTVYERAYRERSRLLGPGDRATHEAAMSLVSLHVLDRRMDDAARLARATLAQVRRSTSPRDPLRADALGTLAMVLANTGPLAEAEALRREEIALRTEVLGADHPGTAGAINDLASTLFAQRRFDEAADLFRRVLVQRRAKFDPAHPSIATVANNLAICELELGNATRGKPLAEEALRIRLAKYGTAHHTTATSLHTLGVIELELGEPAALQYLRRAVASWEAAMGKDSSPLRTPLRDLARAELVFGHPDPACTAANRAHALTRGEDPTAEKARYVDAVLAACEWAGGKREAEARLLAGQRALLNDHWPATDLRIARLETVVQAARRLAR
jgi:serine/threonine-protein kinase